MILRILVVVFFSVCVFNLHSKGCAIFCLTFSLPYLIASIFSSHIPSALTQTTKAWFSKSYLTAQFQLCYHANRREEGAWTLSIYCGIKSQIARFFLVKFSLNCDFFCNCKISSFFNISKHLLFKNWMRYK